MTSGKRWSLRFDLLAQSDASRWDEVLRALPLLSRNTASEEPLCDTTVVRMALMVGCTALSERIPSLDHQVGSRSKVTASRASPWRRALGSSLPGEGPLRILGQLIGEPEQVWSICRVPSVRPRLLVVGQLATSRPARATQSPRSGAVSPGRRLARRP